MNTVKLSELKEDTMLIDEYICELINCTSMIARLEDNPQRFQNKNYWVYDSTKKNGRGAKVIIDIKSQDTFSNVIKEINELELKAKEYDKIVFERDYYKNRYQNLKKENEALKEQIKAFNQVK